MSILTLLNRARKATPIGVDAGARSVRAVQLTQTGTQYVIHRVARIAHHIRADNATDARADLATEIRDCIGRARFRGTRVRVALNTPDVEIHALELPDAIAQSKPSEAERIVQWEVRRLVTQEDGELETRFWHLPKTRPSVPNAIGVAAPSDAVLGIFNACRNAGATCTGVDVAAAALARFGGLLARWPEDTVWGMLDIGLRRTRLIVCIDEVPVLVRDVGSGGEAWTNRISESLALSERTAEIHKRDAGIALLGRGVRDKAKEAPLSELGAILTGILKNDLNGMATQIKRSYEYVLNCYGGRKAGSLVLVGGGAALRNLPEFLTQSLGIPVQRASDLVAHEDSNLQIGPLDAAPLEEYALAIGLAIEA